MRRGAEPFPPGTKTVPFGEPPVHRTLGVLERMDNPRAELVKTLYGALKEETGSGSGKAAP